MNHYQTKYLKPTDARGSRIRVTWIEDGRVRTRIVPYDHAARDPHAAAIAEVEASREAV